MFEKLGLKELELELRLITPLDIIAIASNSDSISISFTPSNIDQVNYLVQQIKTGNPDLLLLEKLGKVYSAALVNSYLLRITNNNLITAE